MKTLLALLCALALAGCAGLNDRSYGSWLENVGKPPAKIVPLTPERTASLQSEAAQLRAESDALRSRLAVERDRVRRVEYIRELRDLGDRLHPIEQALRNGGFEPMPAPI